MRVFISLAIIMSSSLAYGRDRQPEAAETRALKLEASLNAKGVAVLCVDSETGNNTEKLAEIMNSVLGLVKSNVEVSQPALQNAGYRNAAICVTVTRK